MRTRTSASLAAVLAISLMVAPLMFQSPAQAGRGSKARRAAGGGETGVYTKGKAFDYRKLKKKLTKVKYKSSEIKRFECPEGEGLCEEFSPLMKMPEDDGQATGQPVRVHLEIVRPKANKKYPVILESSPYHGTLADRSGTRIFPGPKAKKLPPWVDSKVTPGGVETDQTLGLAGYFAPRGYAVVFMDLRGTGMSGGCLDHLGEEDKSDIKDVINWIVKQKWSNGRVGMIGHSYVGSTPSAGAASGAKGLKAIVPSAGLAAMYHHKYQHGVPYFLQWAGPAEAYEELAFVRFLPEDIQGTWGESFGEEEYAEYFGCGALNSAAVSAQDYESGRYDDESLPPPPAWDPERDHRLGAMKSKVPTFAIHGVNDNAARIPGMDWFHDRFGRKYDKAWIGQWDHGSNFYPNDRTCGQHVTTDLKCPNDQYTLAIHAWFDKHLAQRKINTGPRVELFMNDRKTVYQTSQWPPRPANKASWFYLNPEVRDNGLMTLSTKKVAEADQDFATFAGAATSPLNASSEFDEEEDLGENALGWETDPFKKDTLLAGIPKQKLFATIAADPGTPPHVIATLYDVAPNGNIVCVPIYTTAGAQRCGISKATFAMNPELHDANLEDEHDNIFTPSVRTQVVPGPPCPFEAPACPHKMRLNTRGMAQVYKIEEGHSLRLVIATSQPDKVPTRPEGAVTVYMGPSDQSRIGVPVVRKARLRKDNFYTSGGADGQ